MNSINRVRVMDSKKRAKSELERLSQRTPVKKNDPDIADRENAFLLYASFNGDVVKTAHALGSNAVTVLQVAESERRMEKIKAILELKKQGKPGDVERALSRTMNFVQAHRMRVIVEKLIQRFSEMTEDELIDYCIQDVVTTHKDGSTTVEKKLTTRPFADLAAAMEKVHVLCYMALNDTVTERAARVKREEDDGPAATDIHATIAKAMSEVGASTSPHALLFDAQLAQAKGIENAIKDPVAALGADTLPEKEREVIAIADKQRAAREAEASETQCPTGSTVEPTVPSET